MASKSQYLTLKALLLSIFLTAAAANSSAQSCLKIYSSLQAEDLQQNPVYSKALGISVRNKALKEIWDTLLEAMRTDSRIYFSYRRGTTEGSSGYSMGSMSARVSDVKKIKGKIVLSFLSTKRTEEALLVALEDMDSAPRLIPKLVINKAARVAAAKEADLIIQQRETNHLAELAQQSGALSLFHYIRDIGGDLSPAEKLLTILKDGFLDAESSPVHEGDLGNYLMIQMPKSQTQNNISLHFDLNLLERNDFVANRGWSYGINSRSIPRNSEDMRQFIMDAKGLLNGGMSHELIFKKPILLNHLTMIKVPFSEREEILSMLEANQIPSPNERPWSELIVGF